MDVGIHFPHIVEILGEQNATGVDCRRNTLEKKMGSRKASVARIGLWFTTMIATSRTMPGVHGILGLLIPKHLSLCDDFDQKLSLRADRGAFLQGASTSPVFLNKRPWCTTRTLSAAVSTSGTRSWTQAQMIVSEIIESLAQGQAAGQVGHVTHSESNAMIPQRA